MGVQIGSGEGSDWAEGVQFGFVRFARILVTRQMCVTLWLCVLHSSFGGLASQLIFAMEAEISIFHSKWAA